MRRPSRAETRSHLAQCTRKHSLGRCVASAVLAACQDQSAVDAICAAVASQRAEKAYCTPYGFPHFAIWGFADTTRRNALLRVLRWACKTKVVHAAQTGASRFEAFVVAPRNPELLEDFLSLFRMNAGCCDLNSTSLGCSPLEMACIDRIEKGHSPFGNWHSRPAQSLKFNYMFCKRSAEEREARRRIRDATGMPFSITNTLIIHNSFTLYRAQHREQVERVREAATRALSLAVEEARSATSNEHAALMHTFRNNLSEVLAAINTGPDYALTLGPAPPPPGGPPADTAPPSPRHPPPGQASQSAPARPAASVPAP